MSEFSRDTRNRLLERVASSEAKLAAANATILEYLPALADAWEWRRDSTSGNNRLMADLDAAIERARDAAKG